MNVTYFRWARCAIISIFFISVLPLSTQASERANSADIQTLVQKLQKGGYVIYIRHATTDHNKVDKDGTNRACNFSVEHPDRQGDIQSLLPVY